MGRMAAVILQHIESIYRVQTTGIVQFALQFNNKYPRLLKAKNCRQGREVKRDINCFLSFLRFRFYVIQAQPLLTPRIGLPAEAKGEPLGTAVPRYRFILHMGRTRTKSFLLSLYRDRACRKRVGLASMWRLFFPP